MGKEGIVVHLRVLSQHLPEETEQNHIKPLRRESNLGHPEQEALSRDVKLHADSVADIVLAKNYMKT
jgi:hypothetical protein